MVIQLSIIPLSEDDEYQAALADLRKEKEQTQRAQIVLEECERRYNEAWLRVLELEQPAKGRGN